MKKLILTLLVATSFLSAAPSYAWNHGGNGYHGGYNNYRGGYNNNYYRGGYNNNYRGGYNNNWVAPAIGGLILGGIVGAAITSPYYSPAPVYVQPDPVYTSPPSAPVGYHYEQMLDNNCNCYVTVLVPN